MKKLFIPPVLVLFSLIFIILFYFLVPKLNVVPFPFNILVKKKREYWEQIVPDWKDVLVLIKVVPQKLEVVNYKYGLYGNPVTWKAPSIEF
jgi:hypothetical protein